MINVQWDDSYTGNDPEIDEQHQKWISLCNRMQSTLLNGTLDEVADAGHKDLVEMMEYAKYHFHQEERYMIDRLSRN